MKYLIAILLVGLTAQVVQADCQLERDEDPEELERVARCFEAAGQIGGAVGIYDRLSAKFPSTAAAARGQLRAGELLAGIARVDDAARRLELFARRYAGERSAFTAMTTAARYRAALGDHAAWIADTQFAIRVWGAKQPDEAARLMFELADAFPDDRAATERQLREYLARFAGLGGAERLVLAHARLAELAWRDSCPVEGVDGLCARPSARERESCLPDAVRLTTVSRDPRRVKQARSDLSALIAVFETQPAARTSLAARHAYAMAKVTLADHDLEKVLAIRFPPLDFSPTGSPRSQRSQRRFASWLERQNRDGGVLVRRYQAVIELREPVGAVVAMARIGEVNRNLWAQITAGRVPRDLRSGTDRQDKLAAYCGAIADVTTPLLTTARDTFAACAARANELGVHDRWARRCMRELVELDPETFPAFTERVARRASHEVSLVTASPQIQTAR